MRDRSNPWPSFVDLFAAIMITTLAGIIVFSVAYKDVLRKNRYYESELKKCDSKLKGCILKNTILNKARKKADEILQNIKNSLDPDFRIGSKIRSCGQDKCLDLAIHFALNDDVIENPEEKDKILMVCQALKNALDKKHDNLDLRRYVRIIIEGHTDKQQARLISNPRKRFMFNWVLSGRRAASILYEFQKCGLTTPHYNIVALGYADTQPLCHEDTEECYKKNRRTTLRLSIDYDTLVSSKK